MNILPSEGREEKIMKDAEGFCAISSYREDDVGWDWTRLGINTSGVLPWQGTGLLITSLS